jgi:hypothetical protein
MPRKIKQKKVSKKMSVDGVWKVEMLGPYGWENIATAFLQGGRYLAASADHYSIGSYELDGDAFTADIWATQSGKVRSIYGSKKKRVHISMEARIKSGRTKKADKIVGSSLPSVGKDFDVRVRLIRVGDLD